MQQSICSYLVVSAMRDPQMWANKMLSNTLHLANTTTKGGIIADKNAFDDRCQAEHSDAQPDEFGERTKPNRQLRASKFITMRQATNIVEAVRFAKSINLPLVAHLTIHWSLTDVGDDPDGKLFAKVREGLDKWLQRHGVEFAGIWARERLAGGQSDVVHCHLLFHLPVEYRTGKKVRQVENAIFRLAELHGRGLLHEHAIDLRVHDNPDGKYLIKGGGPKIWKRFGIRKKDRRAQGLIFGKRCGTTENIGAATRSAKRSQQQHLISGR